MFRVLNGQFERRALQVIQQDFKIVRIDVSMLGRALEQVFGMLHNVLIDGRTRGHHDGERSCVAAPSDPMSMPSSRALVATTARMSPERKRFSISRRSPGR